MLKPLKRHSWKQQQGSNIKFFLNYYSYYFGFYWIKDSPCRSAKSFSCWKAPLTASLHSVATFSKSFHTESKTLSNMKSHETCIHFVRECFWYTHCGHIFEELPRISQASSRQYGSTGSQGSSHNVRVLDSHIHGQHSPVTEERQDHTKKWVTAILANRSRRNAVKTWCFNY